MAYSFSAASESTNENNLHPARASGPKTVRAVLTGSEGLAWRFTPERVPKTESGACEGRGNVRPSQRNTPERPAKLLAVPSVSEDGGRTGHKPTPTSLGYGYERGYAQQGEPLDPWLASLVVGSTLGPTCTLSSQRTPPEGLASPRQIARSNERMTKTVGRKALRPRACRPFEGLLEPATSTH